MRRLLHPIRGIDQTCVTSSRWLSLALDLALLAAGASPRAAAARRAALEAALAKLAAEASTTTPRRIAGARRDRRCAADAGARRRSRDGRLSSASRRQDRLHRKTSRRPLHRPADRRTVGERRRRRPEAGPASTTASAARIDAALGALTLLSPDPAQRLAAARGGVQSRDPARCRRSRRRSPRRPMPASSARWKQARGGHRRSACRRAGGRAGRRDRDPRATRRPATRSALLTLAASRQPASVAEAAADGASPRSSGGWRCGTRRRTSGSACRSARCCCSPRSASPSPSA